MSIMRKLQQIDAAIRQLRKGCHYYDASLVAALASTLKLYLRDQFSLKEILGYGLYIPRLRDDLPILISKEKSLAKLAKTNPREEQAVTENKAIFYQRCREAGLPIPETYGVFDRGQGTDRDGAALRGKDDWVSYFAATLPAHFIIKDVGGAYGSGFGAFERCNGHYREAGGRMFDGAGLYEELVRRSDSGLVVQERLFDHSDLEALSGRPGLQTMRVNTEMDAKGKVSLLFYWLKIRVGDNLADNFSMGTVGNLAGFGKWNEGVLEGARTCEPCGSGFRTVYTHPETGVSLKGFSIPLWEQAIELAKTAHRSFAKCGTLGWDVAMTPTGPRIIETNIWWDPPLFAPQVMSRGEWRRVFG